MARNNNTTSIEVAVAALLVSVAAHVVLWSLSEVLGLNVGGATLPKTQGVMEVSLVDPREEDDAEQRDEKELEGKQLVDLDYLDKEEAPDDPKYVAEFDNNPDKQYRAPKARPSPGGAGRPDGQDEPQEDLPSAKQKAGMALPLGGREAIAGDAETSKPGEDTREKSELGGDSSKPRTLSPRSARGLPDSMRKEWGTPGTHDALEDDLEVGPGNILETKRYKFASFFNRVRNGVAQHWHPEVVHAANDPDGRIYGTKTRRTRLLISLNADGSLHKVRLDASSNVDYLDEEAIRAVRQAAPFTNPPPGLVDDASGRIEFGFAFIFEIHGGRRIFRYRN